MTPEMDIERNHQDALNASIEEPSNVDNRRAANLDEEANKQALSDTRSQFLNAIGYHASWTGKETKFDRAGLAAFLEEPRENDLLKQSVIEGLITKINHVRVYEEDNALAVPELLGMCKNILEALSQHHGQPLVDEVLNDSRLTDQLSTVLFRLGNRNKMVALLVEAGFPSALATALSIKSIRESTQARLVKEQYKSTKLEALERVRLYGLNQAEAESVVIDAITNFVREGKPFVCKRIFNELASLPALQAVRQSNTFATECREAVEIELNQENILPGKIQNLFELPTPEQAILIAKALLDTLIEHNHFFAAFQVAQFLPETISEDTEQQFHLEKYARELAISDHDIYRQFVALINEPAELERFIDSTNNSYPFFERIQLEPAPSIPTETEMAMIRNGSYIDQSDIAYRYGLPIAETITTANDHPDALSGRITFHDKSFMQSLVDHEAVANEFERQQIEARAVPIKHIRNLATHNTNVDRVPFIAQFGLLSRAVLERFIYSRYRGFTAFGSGWGRPFIGDNLIDIHDPSRHVVQSEETTYDGRSSRSVDFHGHKEQITTFWRKPDTVMKPISYELSDQPIQLAGFFRKNGATKTTSVTLVIQLEPHHIDRIARIKGESSYIVNRVEPSELSLVLNTEPIAALDHNEGSSIGLVKFIETVFAAKQGKKLPSDWSPTLTFDRAVEVLGSNIKMPIYDQDCNLIWPSKVNYDILLEREKDKRAPSLDVLVTSDEVVE